MIQELNIKLDSVNGTIEVHSKDELKNDFTMQRKIATAMLARVLREDAPDDIRVYMSMVNAEISIQALNLMILENKGK